jgi:serine protease Do
MTVPKLNTVAVTLCCALVINPLPVDAAELIVVGTGFFVSGTGHVLTNNHVVRECRSIYARGVNGQTVDVSILGTDNRNDLALLATSEPASNSLSFQFGARVGDAAFVYGFPLNGLLSSNGNFTTGTVTALAGIADDSRMLQISAPVQPGNSGGPLLSQTGGVIGVISSKLDALKVETVTKDIPQNVNFAIKTSAVVAFLETAGVKPLLFRPAHRSCGLPILLS